MNKDEVVTHMITFIEEGEKDLQAANLVGESKSARADIVNGILNELEREVNNEN